jgi:carnitine 3-dehydrogenase
MTQLQRVACIGGGVIGAGWVARFILNGIDVGLYDPDPDAQRKVDEILSGAARAFAKLIEVEQPTLGQLTFCDSIEAAVSDAQLIQESAPERLQLKQGILEEIDRHAPPEAIIGSSTSGLLPSDLQAKLQHPERLLVAHPYNPVYLLPLVELVGGKATDPECIARADSL